MQGVEHVVLEVDAPVHEGAKAYEANGFVSCHRGVYNIAYACSALAVMSCGGEDASCGIGDCGSANTLEAYGLETMGLTTLHVCEVL